MAFLWCVLFCLAYLLTGVVITSLGLRYRSNEDFCGGSSTSTIGLTIFFWWAYIWILVECFLVFASKRLANIGRKGA